MTNPRIQKLVRYAFNLREMTEANNDFAEHLGDGIHGHTIRLVVTRFLWEHTTIREVKMACAIEWLVHKFTQNEYMARLMASAGIDFKVMQVTPKDEIAIRKWLNNIELPAPKVLADLMEAVAWAAVKCTGGCIQLADHYYSVLIVPMKEAMKPFNRRWDKEGWQSFFAEFEERWLEHHNQHLVPRHISAFIERTKRLSLRSSVFDSLKRILVEEPPELDPDGRLNTYSLSLAYSGFALLDMLWRQEIELFFLEYLASIAGGAHLASVMRRMVLCDRSLASIVDRIELYEFPKTVSAQTKAQTLSFAAMKLHDRNPAHAESTLCLALGVLVGAAHDVASDFGIPRRLEMPSSTPYSISPPPLEDQSTSSSTPREILYPLISSTTQPSSKGRSPSPTPSLASTSTRDPMSSMSASQNTLAPSGSQSGYQSSRREADLPASPRSYGSNALSKLTRLFQPETYRPQPASGKLKGKQRAR